MDRDDRVVDVPAAAAAAAADVFVDCDDDDGTVTELKVGGIDDLLLDSCS
jgi:glutamate mutase epsilon subunit